MEIDLGGFGFNIGLDTSNEAELNNADNAAMLAAKELEQQSIITVSLILGSLLVFIVVIFVLLK
jgi:hypothetical protein